MKYWPLIVLFMGITLACGSKNNQQKTDITMGKTYLFLVGTYTENPKDGIHLVKFSPDENLLETVSIASEVENPSFVITNKEQNLVFAVEETGGDEGGKVTSFRFNKAAHTFEKINSVFTQGDHPCHLGLDPSERYLIASNYSGGNLTAIPIGPDGNLSHEIQVVQHSGSSTNPNRQKAPHVHSAAFHPKEPKIFVGDLGTDKINVYTYDKDSPNPLTPSDETTFSVAPGAGPRHLVFNEEGTRLYLIHEITAEIGVYAYEDEKISHIETHSLLRDGFEGEVGAAEVRLSPEGNYLYASNRGEANDIAVFKIKKENGQLSHVQNQPSGGETPRNFAITPDGKYLISGNQNSDNLMVFNRDQETGKLKPMSISLSIKKPVYIYFLN